MQLTTEHASAPIDVDVADPRLAWQIPGMAQQYAYQIAVASDPALIGSGRADVWDSGRVVSAAQTDVPYRGSSLESNATYFWAVRVWSAEGAAPGLWSEVARFETGLFSSTDWTAKWIGRENPETVPALGAQPRAPLLRKEFTLDDSVTRARLRIVGLGYYVASINGQRVGDHVLDPPPSTFNETALYATYDVTDTLQTGENAIGVTLGRGYFGAPSSADLVDFAAAPWRNEPRLLAQLDVTYRDGSTARVVSDGSWAMTDGPIMDSARVGEDYDARLDPSDWTHPGFDASAWTPAPEQPAPTRNVRSVAMEPIRIIETLSPLAAR
jgi:alpha-L-rhamnosidase